jgi:putative restriction endonuclease
VCFETNVAVKIMGYGVLVHRSVSIYDDSPAERYQFPSQYLGRIESCVGDWIVYYEPAKALEARGYSAVAKIQRVIPDPDNLGMYLALMEPGTYLDFVNPVPFRDSTGSDRARCSKRAGEDIWPRAIGSASTVGG